MKRWEYYISAFITEDISSESFSDTQARQLKLFDVLGNNGWELVAIHECGSTDTDGLSAKSAVFKREKEETAEEEEERREAAQSDEKDKITKDWDKKMKTMGPSIYKKWKKLNR